MVGAYDGMHVMYKMIESQKGKPWNSTAAIESIKGFTWDSPRGQVRINSITRDINQPYFIRRVQRGQRETRERSGRDLAGHYRHNA